MVLHTEATIENLRANLQSESEVVFCCKTLESQWIKQVMASHLCFLYTGVDSPLTTHSTKKHCAY